MNVHGSNNSKITMTFSFHVYVYYKFAVQSITCIMNRFMVIMNNKFRQGMHVLRRKCRIHKKAALN